MTHQLWFNCVSSNVSLQSSKIQQSAEIILTVLKSCFAATLPDVIDPMFVSERVSSLPRDGKLQLLTLSISNELLHLLLCHGGVHDEPIFQQLVRKNIPTHICG